MTEGTFNRTKMAGSDAKGATGEPGIAAGAETLGLEDGQINILIVDDEPKNLTVLETILNEPGYRLVRADSADKALLALLVDEFALIVLDISMPAMNGFELASIIKARKKTALVPIIFLTAYYNEDQHILDGYGAGAVDYLHKPVNPAVLRSKVAVFAELHRKSRALEAANRTLLAEITERQRAEEQLRELNETLDQRVRDQTEALRESERQYRGMIDALPAAVYTTDASGRFNHMNPAAIKLGGGAQDQEKQRWSFGWTLYRPDHTPIGLQDCPLALAMREKRPILGAELIVEQPDGHRTPMLSYPTPMFNSGGDIVGGINILVDVSDRKRTEEQIRLLINEVNHRSKNMLAVVEAIARQTAAKSPKDFVQNFSQRVRALAASHDLLVKNEWQGIEISELVRAQLAHFEDLLDKRILLEGPAVCLKVASAQCIGMIVHELATNAAKHGALSNENGFVEIGWRIDGDGAAPVFRMDWTERDGPAVALPEHRGFGSTVVKTLAERNLEGEVEIDYAPAGFLWRLRCPAIKTIEPTSAAAASPRFSPRRFGSEGAA